MSKLVNCLLILVLILVIINAVRFSHNSPTAYKKNLSYIEAPQKQEEVEKNKSQVCQPKYISEYKCSGDWSQRKYQLSDCNYIWIMEEGCKYGCNKEGKCRETSPCKGYADCFTDTVNRVVDGDTLNVGGKQVRLSLVNTPENDEAGFIDAKEFTENLCPIGSSALVDEDDGQTSKNYERIIAVVYCNGYNLNEQLLKAHKGQILTYFCNISEFSDEAWAISFGC